MKKIKVKNSSEAIVDNKDYKYLKTFSWHLTSGYPATKKKGVYERMHRKILNLKNSKLTVDHIDGNKLNNTRKNLRICSARQNSFNKGMSKNNTSGYKGVYWFKRDKLWVAGIGYNKKTYNLGRFKNKHDAAKAYNNAAVKYFGKYAKLNKIEE